MVSIFMNKSESVQKLKAFELVGGAVAYAKEEKYQLSFTGHSLGAFLAELSVYFCHTAFDYPEVNAVTFESPGIGEMLDKIGAEHETLNVENLDILSYLSYPNIVNTCNHHVGTLYSIMPVLNKNNFGYFSGNVQEVHSMDNILAEFEEGHLPKRAYVTSWPVGKQRQVFEKFYQEIHQARDDSELVRYELSLDEDNYKAQFKSLYIGKYQTKTELSGEHIVPLRHFHTSMRQYLKQFYKKMLTALRDDEALDNIKNRVIDDCGLPEKKLPFFFGYTIRRTETDTECLCLFDAEMKGSHLRAEISSWLSKNPEKMAKLLTMNIAADGGLTVEAVGAKDGAELETNKPMTFNVTGMDVCPTNEEEVAYIKKFIEPTLKRVRHIKATGIEGTFKVSGDGAAPVTLNVTGMRFGSGSSKTAEQIAQQKDTLFPAVKERKKETPEDSDDVQQGCTSAASKKTRLC